MILHMITYDFEAAIHPENLHTMWHSHVAKSGTSQTKKAKATKQFIEGHTQHVPGTLVGSPGFRIHCFFTEALITHKSSKPKEYLEKFLHSYVHFFKLILKYPITWPTLWLWPTPQETLGTHQTPFHGQAWFDNRSLDKGGWLLKENSLRNGWHKQLAELNKNQNQSKQFQMERWIFACLCTFALWVTEGRAQHPMKHTLAWWAPVVYHHHLKNPNHLVAALRNECQTTSHDEEPKGNTNTWSVLMMSKKRYLWQVSWTDLSVWLKPEVGVLKPHWRILALATSLFSFPLLD